MPTSDNPKLDRIEERLRVETERVVTGRVRVTTDSELIEELAHVALSTEQVEVTREKIGREVSEVPQMRIEGDVTIIPILEEIVVVEKRLVLVEEVRIRRIATTEDVTIPVTLRKQTARIERTNNESPNEEKQ